MSFQTAILPRMHLAVAALILADMLPTPAGGATELPTADAGLERNAQGVLIRGDANAPRAALVFAPCDRAPEKQILDALQQRGLKASFFFTADALRSESGRAGIKQLAVDGHYAGPVADAGLRGALAELRTLALAQEGGTIFAFADGERLATDVAAACRELKVELVGPTPSAARGNPAALRGVIIVIQPDSERSETLIAQVDALRDDAAHAGCEFVRIDQLCATAMKPVPRDPRYPPHWWTPAPTAGAPAWEILPQAAGPGEVILSKRSELGLLSNFAATSFTMRGKRYASVEGFWQMMKFPEGPDDPRATFPGVTWPYTRKEVAKMTAFEAKDAGSLASKNMNRMSIDWVSFEGRRFPYRPAEPGEQYKLVVEAMRAKLEQNPEVKRVLLASGDLVLKPDHHQEENPPQAWRYFDIWMELRAVLAPDAS